MQAQTKDISVSEVESDPSISCSRGKHQFILDEQIGIRCKFCSFLELDIKHVFPSWAPNSGGRFTRSEIVNKEGPLFVNGFFCKEKDYSCQGSCDYEKGTVWDLIPGIRGTMYPHQQEAFEFMWRNLSGTILLDDLESFDGSDGTGGCVISHAPGTGKTRLSIVFIQSYMKRFPECRPVIIAQPIILETWKREFKKWGVSLKVHDLGSAEFSCLGDDWGLELMSKGITRDISLIRLFKFCSWNMGNSVILLSYKLLAHLYRSKDSNLISLKNILLEKAGLIIFDEGHTARNVDSDTWKAAEKFKTSKRVILSGTPFQNNFTELYNTLSLVRPKFAEKISTRISKLGQTKKVEILATKKENFPEKNEAKSKWGYLTKSVTVDSKELETNIREVKSIIMPFVHVYNVKILDTLPGLRKCIIVLNLVPQQKIILEKIQSMLRPNSFFDSDNKNSLVCTHPSLAMGFLSEEDMSQIGKQMLDEMRLNPYEGVKTAFVTELVRLCEERKEKVLVFSQLCPPLEMIREQLVKLFNWTEGKEVLKMTGKTTTKNRQPLIQTFNESSSEARVLLASTTACGEGISLVGASRVVLLDVLWNPSREHQAVSRAFRIGQRNFVYVYQLVTYGTGESKKYGLQASKDKMSKLVFSPEIDPNTIKASNSHAEEDHTSNLVKEDKILMEMKDSERLKDLLRKIYYPSEESDNLPLFSEEDINL